MSENPFDSIDAADPDQKSIMSEVDKSQTKAEAAVTLFVYGASPSDIAKTLNYSSAYRARMAVERALAGAEHTMDDKEKVRKVIDKRLNRLLAAHMGQAVDVNNPNQLAHSARALAIIDRQAKLHGVDAPTQIQVSASDQHIEEFISAMLPHTQQDNLAIEADIMDADILEEAEDDGQP